MPAVKKTNRKQRAVIFSRRKRFVCPQGVRRVVERYGRRQGNTRTVEFNKREASFDDEGGLV